MQDIYMLDAKTYAGLRNLCAALAHNPDRAEALAALLAALLSRATRAELELDERPAACLQ